MSVLLVLLRIPAVWGLKGVRINPVHDLAGACIATTSFFIVIKDQRQTEMICV